MTETGQSLSLHQATLFAQKYADATSEKQLAQSFWRDLFTNVVGIHDLMAAGIEFEHPVKTEAGTINFIDVLWSGVVLVEHKSAGKNLDDAEKQARDYLVALPTSKRPPTIVLSDFKRIRIVEVLKGESAEFKLSELPENLDRLEMVVGKHVQAATRSETTADQEAVQLMANLFVEFEKAGYEGHEVSVLLVRLLFLNFGDDTRMWKRIPGGLFGNYVSGSSEDGTGLGGQLQELFQILDTPREKRSSTISDQLIDFPYVNGGLFKEVLPVFSFNRGMRDALIRTTEYDWSKISPAIFGAMFQTVKSKEDRRHLGEHYTSEENILKVIRPLFLDDLNDRLMKNWDSIHGLKKLKTDLSKNHYLDPACGSGNFLVVTYKRLRELELKLTARLQELEGKVGDLALDGTWGLSVTLDQFHGIEINEWSSQIATVAMYLADHQANLEMEAVTGSAPTRFPLSKTANIVHANALQIDWQEVCPMSENSYIMGNPPFYGARWQSKEQKEDLLHVWGNIKGSGNLDFVTGWFILAAKHIGTSNCSAAFVATSSITQGEQPGLIWPEIYKHGSSIDFAYRPFEWSNEAAGKAGVHVVVIGFSRKNPKHKTLWYFNRGKGTPIKVQAEKINEFLLDAPSVIISVRKKPLSPISPLMENGSMPNDGGHLSNISPEEAMHIRDTDSIASKYLRKLIGAREMIHNEERYALWLVDAPPSDIRKSKTLTAKVGAVLKLREESTREATRKLASKPSEFGENRQPNSSYIAVPRITSEDREYVPIGIYSSDVILNDKISYICPGEHWVFTILSSKVFNVWNKAISGRTRNDTLISNTITWNNFPIPVIAESHFERLEQEAQKVLSIRERYLSSSLADLYSSVSMPGDLREAHRNLDSEVLKLFGLASDASNDAILERLFALYSEFI